MALYVEGRGLVRIQSLPTQQSHDHTDEESLDFPWETEAMILIFPVEEVEGKACRPFIRKTTLIPIRTSRTVVNHQITEGPTSKESETLR